jgi:hypothetical protein
MSLDDRACRAVRMRLRPVLFLPDRLPAALKST